MILFKPFEIKDLEFDGIEPAPMWDAEFAQAVEASGLAASGVKNNCVIGCGGVHPIDKEQGLLWLRLHPWCRTHGLETALCIRSFMKIVEKTFPFSQLKALIQDGFGGDKLMKVLRFKKTDEATLNDLQYSVYIKDVQ